jgi:hypothetical protein
LNLTPLINSEGERGLLGLAFHPKFATNGFFYVYYTGLGPNFPLTVARDQVSAGNPNLANPASAQVLLQISHAENTNHNGGMLAFGPDGMLYAGTGDGGGAGDLPNNAQNLCLLLGKLLRINVDAPSPGLPYGIPADNPFVGAPGARGEIWALGLRNPWRFSFDRSLGDLWLGDVGQGSFEEIDFSTSRGRGANLQWRCIEGFQTFTANPPCNQGTSTAPIFAYGHGSGDCSTTGGYRYFGTALPSLVGDYVYGDFCSGRVWALHQVGADQSGESYVVGHDNGTHLSTDVCRRADADADRDNDRAAHADAYGDVRATLAPAPVEIEAAGSAVLADGRVVVDLGPGRALIHSSDAGAARFTSGPVDRGLAAARLAAAGRPAVLDRCRRRELRRCVDDVLLATRTRLRAERTGSRRVGR